jgi:ribosomal protein S4E
MSDQREHQTPEQVRSGFVQMIEYQQRRAQLAYYAGDEVIVREGEGAGHSGVIMHVDVDPQVSQPYTVKLGNGHQVTCAEHELARVGA